jgi:hypothetical protein
MIYKIEPCLDLKDEWSEDDCLMTRTCDEKGSILLIPSNTKRDEFLIGESCSLLGSWRVAHPF